MRTYPDCIQCFDRNFRFLAGKFAKDESVRQEMLKRISAEVEKFDTNLPPPAFARYAYRIIADFSGERDAYRKEKIESTIAAKQLLETFIKEDPSFDLNDFETLVRLAIAGNIIDFGVNTSLTLDAAKEIIRESLRKPVSRENLEKFRELAEKAQNILYILDNCGEAVFDRLLLERFGSKTTLCVRGYPVLNDVTRNELEMSGLSGVAKRIIDTGDYTPGITMEKSGAEFRQAYEEADLVIAKGQGNFETLSDGTHPTVFLFMAKCQTVCAHIGAELNSLQVRLEGI